MDWFNREKYRVADQEEFRLERINIISLYPTEISVLVAIKIKNNFLFNV